jgi:hypothetical protein
VANSAVPTFAIRKHSPPNPTLWLSPHHHKLHLSPLELVISLHHSASHTHAQPTLPIAHRTLVHSHNHSHAEQHLSTLPPLLRQLHLRTTPPTLASPSLGRFETRRCATNLFAASVTRPLACRLFTAHAPPRTKFTSFDRPFPPITVTHSMNTPPPETVKAPRANGHAANLSDEEAVNTPPPLTPAAPPPRDAVHCACSSHDEPPLAVLLRTMDFAAWVRTGLCDSPLTKETPVPAPEGPRPDTLHQPPDCACAADSDADSRPSRTFSRRAV